MTHEPTGLGATWDHYGGLINPGGRAESRNDRPPTAPSDPPAAL